MKPHFSKLFAALALSTAIAGTSHAVPFSGLVFFGDSLSDTGNVLSLTTALGSPPFPAFPGAEGRFSNGPVWTETLAMGLGIPGAANPANVLFTGFDVTAIGAPGGTNYAFGGARTGLGGVAAATTGLVGQLINWNGSQFGGGLTRPADPNTLYIVSAGMNDMRDARSANSGATAADEAARGAAAATAAHNVVNAVALLAQAGARHFLVPNLLDLGMTPEAIDLGVVPASTDASDQFNSALSAALSALDASFLTSTGVDLEIDLLDVNGLFDDVLANPSAYGITNVTTPCISPTAPGAYFVPGAVAVNCGMAAFSDDLHLSALGHRLIGNLALEAVGSSVPEPATLALLGLGLVGVAVARRHKTSVRRTGSAVALSSAF